MNKLKEVATGAFSALFAERFGVAVPDATLRQIEWHCCECCSHPAAYFAELERAVKAGSKAFLGRPADEDLLINGMLLGSAEKIFTVLAASSEHRLALTALHKDLASTPPRRALFDHVAKTGGYAVISVLRFLYPMHVVSPHGNAWHHNNTAVYDPRWSILVGHIGRRHHHLIPDVDERVRMTIVRDPVSWLRSTYSFWRHSIPPEEPDYDTPGPAASREMDFSAYVRSDVVSETLRNFQFRFLSPENDPRASAEAVLSHYDVVGVTADIPGFIGKMLATLGISSSITTASLVQLVSRNSSDPNAKVSDADRVFIGKEWDLDMALYQKAVERSLG